MAILVKASFGPGWLTDSDRSLTIVTDDPEQLTRIQEKLAGEQVHCCDTEV